MQYLHRYSGERKGGEGRMETVMVLLLLCYYETLIDTKLNIINCAEFFTLAEEYIMNKDFQKE